jgi:DNA invertase Pin-like site-specific DNA recombinase
MEIVGYRRTSTDQQNLARQDFPCDKMFEEAASAGTRDRPALRAMIDYVREKDEIRVWSIDRLCRDLRDLQDVIQTVNAKGVSITFLSENLTFTANQNDPFAKLQLQMMGAFAEFERSIIRKRQAEGIAKAKAKGNIYKGRKATIDVTEIKRLKDEGLGATAISKKLNIARASVYRVMQSAS